MDKYNKKACAPIKRVAAVINREITDKRARRKAIESLGWAEHAVARARPNKSLPWESCGVGWERD